MKSPSKPPLASSNSDPLDATPLPTTEFLNPAVCLALNTFDQHQQTYYIQKMHICDPFRNESLF